MTEAKDFPSAKLGPAPRLPTNDRVRPSFAVRASHVRSRLLFMFIDATLVITCYGLAQVAYLRDKAPGLYWHNFAPFLFYVVLVTLIANQAFGLYGRMWRHAGVEEARQVILSASAILVILIAGYPPARALGIERVHLIVITVGAMFATAGMGLIRFHSRLFAWQRGSRRVGLRVAVVGSHDAGAAVIREMMRSPGAGLVPVAVFDDDTRDHGLSMAGVPVVGSIEDIPGAASRFTLQQIFLAIPNPPQDLVERVFAAAERANLTVNILPGVSDLARDSSGAPSLRQARPLRIEDLLGRTPVPIDLDRVRRSLEGRRVLVTGAGGSIGSEICRQVAGLEPALLILLDHDETHLHDTAATLPVRCQQALVDITNRAAVSEAFERFRPEVVFHAAGHKHVPVLEDYPLEAVATNVFGTLNVVEAAVAVETQRFVQISSDKAVRPSSVMGATKRIAEQVILARAPSGASYCTVRFGNVLGSRGSVIPTFARQIADGGPVTVTDDRMTRFFMSVEEAVQLVLESSVLSDGGGEIFMLEMGEPVRILDLATRMIQLSGYKPNVDIPIAIVGARPGEKLDEELREPEEKVLTTHHPYINQLLPNAKSTEQFSVDLERLDQAAKLRNAEAVNGILFAFGSSGSRPGTENQSPMGDRKLDDLSAFGTARASHPEPWVAESASSPRSVERTSATPIKSGSGVSPSPATIW